MTIQTMLSEASKKLDQLILQTPTGDCRDVLTEINILVLKAQDELGITVRKIMENM